MRAANGAATAAQGSTRLGKNTESEVHGRRCARYGEGAKPGEFAMLDYFLLWDRCGSIRIGGHHHWRDRERVQSPELDAILDQFVAGRPGPRSRKCALSRPMPPCRAPTRHGRP